MPYAPPEFSLKAFNCPHCDAYARMIWNKLYFSVPGHGWVETAMHKATCTHCNESSFWVESVHPEGSDVVAGYMVLPLMVTAPHAHPDMPQEVKFDYEEARGVLGNSPRGAAALLRLSIQKLCAHLGESGKNINSDIGALVKKGLPIEIQQALDIVRVVGNNAVHPGELSDGDVAGIALPLFELVNQIVEDRIARPKKLQALFEKLPEGARSAIEKRDES